MQKNSTKFNECVLHFLYGYEITGALIEIQDIDVSMKTIMIAKSKALQALVLAQEISQKIESLDQEIKSFSNNYDPKRVSKIDLSILRWAFFQLDNQREELPQLINEAIRLSKKFSTIEASKFIHAILDARIHCEDRAPATT